MRSGKETDEILPDFLVRIVIESIVMAEPETARAMIYELPRVEVDPHKPYLGKATKPNYSIAMQMAYLMI